MINTLDERESNEFELSNNARQQIRGTAPWLRFIGGVGIFLSGMLFLVSFGYLVADISGVIPTSVGDRSLFFGAMIFYVLYSGLMLFMSLLLFRAGSSYKMFSNTGGVLELEKALRNQRIFWQITGVLTILFMLIYAVMLFAIANDVKKLLS